MRTALLDSYFKTNSLVKQQLDSYNRFVEIVMQAVVDRVGKIETNVEGFELRLGKIRVEPPRFYEVKGGYRQITPTEARLRNITYAAPVFLEIVPLFNGIERPTYSDVFIGEIPVMVKSKLCYLSHMTPDELVEAGEDVLYKRKYRRILPGEMIRFPVVITGGEEERIRVHFEQEKL